MNIMERKNTDLIKEFDRYVRENPEFADTIPQNAVVIMQVEGDEVFNTWSSPYLLFLPNSLLIKRIYAIFVHSLRLCR